MPLLEFPAPIFFAKLQCLVDSIHIGMRGNINCNQAPSGTLISTPKFVQRNPISRKLFFRGLFGQEYAIG